MCYKTKRPGYHLGVNRISILPPACKQEVQGQIEKWKQEHETNIPGRTDSEHESNDG